MPINNREFVQIVKRHASDGAGGDTLKSALRAHPFDTNPDRSERIRKLVEGLSEFERQTLLLMLQEAAEPAVAGTFCVLDGVGGNYAGIFEIYAVDPDDSKNHVNPENTEMLHDIYSELCSSGGDA
jgi:hypothetical protein